MRGRALPPVASGSAGARPPGSRAGGGAPAGSGKRSAPAAPPGGAPAAAGRRRCGAGGQDGSRRGFPSPFAHRRRSPAQLLGNKAIPGCRAQDKTPHIAPLPRCRRHPACSPWGSLGPGQHRRGVGRVLPDPQLTWAVKSPGVFPPPILSPRLSRLMAHLGPGHPLSSLQLPLLMAESLCPEHTQVSSTVANILLFLVPALQGRPHVHSYFKLAVTSAQKD